MTIPETSSPAVRETHPVRGLDLETESTHTLGKLPELGVKGMFDAFIPRL